MHHLITQKHKHLLWKDEVGDTFLLLKYAEVFQLSENVLRLFVFNRKKLPLMRKRGLILNEEWLDEPFTIVDVDRSNLDQIIALGEFRRRPDLNGNWLKDKEAKLAHQIIPYNPTIQTEVPD